MKITSSYIYIIALLFISQFSYGQDFHFSQFENAPSYLNPALSGIYNGQHRLIINNRNESKNDLRSAGFNAVSISYDTRVQISKNAFLGLGANVVSNSSGALDYGTDEYKIATSYVHNISNNPKEPQFISIGIDFGITQRSIDLTNAQWPSQHDGNGGFNPTLPPGNLNNNLLHPDLGIGLVWEKSMKENNAIRVGVSMHHINKAKISFLGDDVRLSRRYSAYASGEIQLKDKLALLPSVLFLSQGQVKQIMFGSSARLYFKPKSTFKYFQLGGWLKKITSSTGSVPNTFAFLIETQIKKLLFAFSYDILKDENITNKGLELSLGYTVG